MLKADKADKADKLVKKALKELCNKFRKDPTLYLEEKHLHNEFDRILKKILEEEEEETTAVTKDGVVFPLIMNEYKTVYHYSREGRFKKRGDGPRSGSLDYVWLWDEWVSKNSYCKAVNKDVDFRRREKDGGKKQDIIRYGKKHDTDRYLVVVEFKFDHYAKFMETTDGTDNEERGERDETGWQKRSQKSALKKMEDDLPLDLNKVDNEEPPFGHVVYFNSRIPLKRDCVKKAFEKMKLEIPKGTTIQLWYMQGGVKTRSPWSQNEDKFPLIHPLKK